MRVLSTAKEMVKYAMMRCAPRLLRHHHQPFANSSRHYMENTILPSLSKLPGGRLLFVGCRSYTLHYRNFFRQPNVEYWTCDVDPAARIWGEGRRHLVCDIRDIDVHVARHFFDIVFLNGVFGYGVNAGAEMNRTVERLHRVLKPGGHLVLGWNSTRIPDPSDLDEINMLYDRKISLPFPIRKTFDDVDHVYDLFRAK